MRNFWNGPRENQKAEILWENLFDIHTLRPDLYLIDFVIVNKSPKNLKTNNKLIFLSIIRLTLYCFFLL